MAWTNIVQDYPNNKVYVANMTPTWVLSTQGGPNVGPMNLYNRDNFSYAVLSLISGI